MAARHAATEDVPGAEQRSSGAQVGCAVSGGASATKLRHLRCGPSHSAEAAAPGELDISALSTVIAVWLRLAVTTVEAPLFCAGGWRRCI